MMYTRSNTARRNRWVPLAPTIILLVSSCARTDLTDYVCHGPRVPGDGPCGAGTNAGDGGAGCAADGSEDGKWCTQADDSPGICIAAKGGCVQSSCGDGFVDRLGVEECDDGNAVTEVCGYGETSCTVCATDCTIRPGATSYCGDGVIDVGHAEACDDANTDAGDGCTSTCTVQTGWTCDNASPPSRCSFGTMVVIHAGTFTMGAPNAEQGHYLDETPQHDVTLTRDFLLSSTEVTQSEFQSLMSWSPSWHTDCADCPVEQVSWYDAVAYMNQLTLKQSGMPCYAFSNVVCVDTTNVGSSYMDCMNTTRRGIDSAAVTLAGVTSVYDCTGFRLPTEAEWEYAARAGDTRATYNGDLDAGHLACEQPNPVLDSIAWFCGDAGVPSHVTGTRAPNPWGLYDMLGNVWEWCWDWYDGVYAPGAVTDPQGPAAGSGRMSRGGSWGDEARHLRAANRLEDDPSYRYLCIGARAARSLP